MSIRLLMETLSADQAAEPLKRAGMSGPHSFIRGLNADYDLDVYLHQLLRPLPPPDDLRFAYGAGTDERWVLMERLPWDSQFFGRGIARLNAVVQPGHKQDLRADVSAGRAALQATLAQAVTHGIDYVFSVVPSTDLQALRALHQAGFELIETRCYYHRPLNAGPGERHAVRLATAEDVPSLARSARTMVNHFDRFHADPEIAPEDADRLMERWVTASICDGFADATVVPDVPEPEAFCTAKYHREHWEGWGMRLAQPVLSAVSPRHKGWYVRIISELEEHLRSIGAEHSFLITQLTNNAVIRCWEKLGYHFGKGEHVLRRVL